VLCARSEPRRTYLAMMAGNAGEIGRQIDQGRVMTTLSYVPAIERNGKYSFVCGRRKPAFVILRAATREEGAGNS